MAKTMKRPPAESIDAYIADFPENIQKILKSIRATVRKAAPTAEETIKYAMPTFTLDGNLIHFAAFQKHIGMYPVPTGVQGWDEVLAPYTTGKGTLQLPLDRPMPLTLISKIVKFNAKRNAEKVKGKKK
jgi:uncharacterized protein YdhG (YjbR/CyaY superfamily)